jgi:probable F420-dependent oxidoreductase
VKPDLGKLGVWTFFDALDATKTAASARRIEELGYSTLFVPEAVGRDPFALLGFLAAQTERLILCTGIANIYARDAVSMRSAQQSLAELSGGRFVLGIGVSHRHLVSHLRGHEYSDKPVSTMRAYLDAMQGALYAAVPPKEEAPILLAALRKNMLRLAAERASGAHPYFVTPEHTARAREILGPDALLAPEQKVLLCSDPEKARAVARQAMQVYTRAPNYQNSLRWLGFDESDFDNTISDRLVDAIVAWGDEDALRARIQAHWDAGADHVCIQPLHPEGHPIPDMEVLEKLAPAA